MGVEVISSHANGGPGQAPQSAVDGDPELKVLVASLDKGHDRMDTRRQLIGPV
jgi:hypothetical protein